MKKLTSFMKKIIITENTQNRLFSESLVMDKERGRSARKFRMALKDAIMNNTYEFDANANKLYINGYSYEIGKKYAETNDGDPIPLHYTFNTVQKLISQLGINTEAQPNLNADDDAYVMTKQELNELNWQTYQTAQDRATIRSRQSPTNAAREHYSDLSKRFEKAKKDAFTREYGKTRKTRNGETMKYGWFDGHGSPGVLTTDEQGNEVKDLTRFGGSWSVPDETYERYSSNAYDNGTRGEFHDPRDRGYVGFPAIDDAVTNGGHALDDYVAGKTVYSDGQWRKESQEERRERQRQMRSQNRQQQ